MGDDGDEMGEDGSEDGACLLWRGRMVYVPVSQMRRDPVAGEAVSMRWFLCRVSYLAFTEVEWVLTYP